MKKQKQILVIMILITIFISILCTYLSHADISHILTGEITYTDSTPAELSPVNSPEVNFPIYSEGAVLMDSSTGKVLYGQNEDEKLYPASTTKILTAILAIEKCNLTDKKSTYCRRLYRDNLEYLRYASIPISTVEKVEEGVE